MADLDIDEGPFIPADWIAKSKLYSDAPFEVIGAKNAVFELPAQVTEMIPPRVISRTMARIFSCSS
ncbi:hypothetical protein B0H10DRAFT_2076677 [Mycena sp. CBHHK59/15]|nr:hypothetical protein B0H10DRAFT_2076677 [Mycena sp. CBHHK59/15]